MAVQADEFGQAIKCGDEDAVESALVDEPALANRTIHWYLNQPIETDPLHFVSDCVFNNWLTNGREGNIARLLLDHGAAIEGSKGRETPLMGAASLGAEKVSKVLVEAGAELEWTGVFGAPALHWAAWVGNPATVELLIDHGAEIEVKCTEYKATPLFWAVHGFSRFGSKKKNGDQVGAAQVLITAGAIVDTTNKEGESALKVSKLGDSDEMFNLLRQYC